MKYRELILSQPENKKSISKLSRKDLYYWINQIFATGREDYKEQVLTLVTYEMNDASFEYHYREYVTDATFKQLLERIKTLNK